MHDLGNTDSASTDVGSGFLRVTAATIAVAALGVATLVTAVAAIPVSVATSVSEATNRSRAVVNHQHRESLRVGCSRFTIAFTPFSEVVIASCIFHAVCQSP
jgi:hypothetical protein